MEKQNKFFDFLNKNVKIIYIAPCIVFLLCMVVFPLGYTLYISFTNWTMSSIRGPELIGFENYMKLFKNQQFLDSIVITLKYSAISLVIEVLVGVILALMLNKKKLFFRNVFKTVMLIPMTMTPVAVGMIWKLLMDPAIGLFNLILKSIGMSPLEWLGSVKSVLGSLILIDVWEWSPMVALIVLAGLSSISDDIYEAAIMDGASYLQRVFHITIPLTLNTILTAALLRLIDVLKTFDIIYSTTAGGPAFKSQTINIFSYLNGFQYYKYGFSSASMVIFTLFVFAVVGLVMFIRAKVVVDR